MSLEVDVTCKNPECRIASSGKCVEGLPLPECPHYGRMQDPQDGIAVRGDFVSLPSAGRLVLLPAASMRENTDARVVAIVGPTDAGKTSLIASLYDLLQNGSVGGLSFARSKSLHAFEEACHKARSASRRAEPGISRTPIHDVAFYHLGLAGSAGEIVDLLLADRAGEDYKAVADDPAICRSYVEIHRADTISILVDGARLLDPTSRHNVRSEALMMLQGLLDGGAIRQGQKIAVVLTKIDEIEASDEIDRQRATVDFNGIVEHVRRLFRFGAVEAHRVAASPRKEVAAVQRGAGVPELLAFWTVRYQVPVTTDPVPESPRAFGRLTRGAH